MTPLPPAGDVLRIVWRWNDASDVDVFNTQYWSYNGDHPDASDCTSIANQALAAMGDMFPLWTAQVQLTGCEVTDLSSASGFQGTASVNTPGTNTGGILAGGTCFVMGFALTRRYRGGKPRQYFPWGATTNLSGRQSWSTDFIAQVTTNYTNFVNAMNVIVGGGTTIANHVNVSYYSGNDAIIDPITGRAKNRPVRRTTPEVDVISGFLPRVTPGSQRRRNRP